MKYLLFIGGLTLAFMFQQAVRTESASNLYANYTTAVTDTIFTKATKPLGSNIRHDNVTGQIVRIVFNTITASDTIQIKNGSGSVGQVVFGLTPPAYPLAIDFDTRVDTSLVVIKKKTSDITVIYRVLRN